MYVIGATISIGREIQSLPYAGLFAKGLYMVKLGKSLSK